jgi:hypothetical protein
MKKTNLILFSLLVVSVIANTLFWLENTALTKLLSQSSTRPDALEGQFCIESELSAVDASTGDPVLALEWLGAAGSGERSVSTALNQKGNLVFFGHASSPTEIRIGAQGYDDQVFQLTKLSPKLISMKMKRTRSEH